jgi:hypothetical protein
VSPSAKFFEVLMRFFLPRGFAPRWTAGIAVGGWLTALAVPLALVACAPEVGSERWCETIGDKGVGNITANEAADYARHCVLE